MSEETPTSSVRGEGPKSRRKMAEVQWRGVLAAITTPFNADLTVDHALLAEHCRWLAHHKVAGIVPIGALGEGTVLTHTEKRQMLETCVGAVGERTPILPRIEAPGTLEAMALARHARAVGCRGLMIAPPFPAGNDWREIRSHIATLLGTTTLPCMLYNHRPPHRVEFSPESIEELCREFPNLQAVKEPSVDVRRITAIRERLGDRVEILTCVEDAIVEGIRAGATGWLACLVNAFPAESVALFDYAVQGRTEDTSNLYRWFLPLLRMDTTPKFVQLIKLAQEQVGRGVSRVRPPRLPLTGEELRRALDTIAQALAARPLLPPRAVA